MTDDSAPEGISPLLGQTPPAAPPPLDSCLGPTAVVESLLKRPLWVVKVARLTQRPAPLLGLLVGVMLACAAVYGVVIGTFSGGQQLWAAPLKFTLGSLAATLFCLPGLYMAACLSGRDVRLAEVAVYLLAAVALCSLLLLGAAPAAWLFSVSTNSFVFIGMLHLFIWSLAIAAGLRLLGLGLRNGDSTLGGHLLLWCVMFVMVCLQMATTLRPLVGTSDHLLPTEKKFFLVHWWDSIQNESNLP